MKKYDIQEDFKGSPDGHTVIQYLKGQKDIALEDSLATAALAEKWVKPSKAAAKAEQEAAAKAEQEAAAKAEQEAAATLVGEEAYQTALAGNANEEQAEAARAQAIADFLQ